MRDPCDLPMDSSFRLPASPTWRFRCFRITAVGCNPCRPGFCRQSMRPARAAAGTGTFASPFRYAHLRFPPVVHAAPCIRNADPRIDLHGLNPAHCNSTEMHADLQFQRGVGRDPATPRPATPGTCAGSHASGAAKLLISTDRLDACGFLAGSPPHRATTALPPGPYQGSAPTADGSMAWDMARASRSPGSRWRRFSATSGSFDAPGRHDFQLRTSTSAFTRGPCSRRQCHAESRAEIVTAP